MNNVIPFPQQRLFLDELLTTKKTFKDVSPPNTEGPGVRLTFRFQHRRNKTHEVVMAECIDWGRTTKLATSQGQVKGRAISPAADPYLRSLMDAGAAVELYHYVVNGARRYWFKAQMNCKAAN